MLQRHAVYPAWPPGSRTTTTNQCFRTMIHSLRAGLGCNKLESPDDSEQCAVEYGARMHNLYVRIPLACYCHIYLVCGGVLAYQCTHFPISPPLQVVCYNLMNKFIYDRVFIGSAQRNEKCNNSTEATSVEDHKYLLSVIRMTSFITKKVNVSCYQVFLLTGQNGANNLNCNRQRCVYSSVVFR